MVPRKQGLIVTVSSPGGLRYLFNCAYGIGKAANDRMAADCGTELKKSNVTMVSLWPGPVKTEKIEESKKLLLQCTFCTKKSLIFFLFYSSQGGGSTAEFQDSETVEFAGKAVAGLAADPNKLSKTAKIVLTSDLAREYGFTDEDGQIHGDIRQIRWMLTKNGYPGMASWVPEWVRVPHLLLHYMSNKF